MYKKNETSTNSIGIQMADQAIFVGEKLSKGTAFIMTATVASDNLLKTNGLDTSVFGTNGVAANNAAIIDPPTNGMGQFKGLSTSTPASKYN